MKFNIKVLYTVWFLRLDKRLNHVATCHHPLPMQPWSQVRRIQCGDSTGRAGQSWPKGSLGSVKKTSRQEDSISHKSRIRHIPQTPQTHYMFIYPVSFGVPSFIKSQALHFFWGGNKMALPRWVLPAHSPVVLAWKRPDLRRHNLDSIRFLDVSCPNGISGQKQIFNMLSPNIA